jgi:outer membrane immunogenic protein
MWLNRRCLRDLKPNRGLTMKKLLFATTALVGALGAAGPVSAADLPVKAAPAPVIAPAAYNWSGFYAGLNGGWSWGKWDVSSNGAIFASGVNTVDFEGPSPLGGGQFSSRCAIHPNFPQFCSAKPNVNGAFGGIQAGYNWQFGQFVFGIEGDMQGSGQDRVQTGEIIFNRVEIAPLAPAPVPPCQFSPTGSNPCQFNFANHWELPWFGTLRARLGWAWDRFMIYATGGLAGGEGRTDFAFTQNFVDVPPTTSKSCFSTLAPPPGTAVQCPTVAHVQDAFLRAGWTAGGGVEWAVTNILSIKAEYLFMDFGSHTVTWSGAQAFPFNPGHPDCTPAGGFAHCLSETIHMRDNLVRVGLNLKLWAPAAPVVARY